MTELEKAIMKMLLAGDERPLVALREQLRLASVVGRTFSGCGFFTRFSVPDDAARVDPPNFEMGDVKLELSGVEHGAGVLLFVHNGVLSMREGYTYGDEGWPEEVRIVAARYLSETALGNGVDSLSPSSTRDLETLRRRLSV
jgi:hypothetical protein